MKLWEMFSDLDELRIDNQHGWGAVPDNQNVDYKGLRVMVKPSVFLGLAHGLDRAYTAKDIEKHIRADGAIAAPFLLLAIPQDWFEGDFSLPAEIYGHEGRNRMTAVLGSEGDVPVEVHLFFGGEIRNRHLTPEIIDRLNRDVISQRSNLVKGPWFSTSSSLSEETGKTDDALRTLINNVRECFADRNPTEALDYMLDGKWTVNDSPELKAIVDANMGQLARILVQELTVGDSDPGLMAGDRYRVEAIGVKIPDEKITEHLRSYEKQLISKLRDIIRRRGLWHAAELAANLSDLGLGIKVTDLIDLKNTDMKNLFIKNMLIDMKEKRESNVVTLIKMLRKSGVDWPELSAFDQALINEAIKVKLSKDPEYFGADVDDDDQDSYPIVQIPMDELIGFEPDDKMLSPKSKANMEKMIRLIKAGKGNKLPPILARRYRGRYQVLDGHHRYHAYKAVNAKSIPAVIIPPENITGDIDEAWSNKYKKSINCSNPKGFSQKAHCAARRKRAKGGKTKSKPVREAQIDRMQAIRDYLNQAMDYDQKHTAQSAREALQNRVWPFITKNIDIILSDKGDKGNGDYPTAAFAAWLLVQHMDAFPERQHEFLLDLEKTIPNHPKLRFLRDRVAVNKEIVRLWKSNPDSYLDKNGKKLTNPTVDVRDPNRFNDASKKAGSREEALNAAKQANNTLLVQAVTNTNALTQPSFTQVKENFADGKGPGRPGDSRRHGIPKNATLAQLDKIGKGSGRKAQLARWQANMRRGRKRSMNEQMSKDHWIRYSKTLKDYLSKDDLLDILGDLNAAIDDYGLTAMPEIIAAIELNKYNIIRWMLLLIKKSPLEIADSLLSSSLRSFSKLGINWPELEIIRDSLSSKSLRETIAPHGDPHNELRMLQAGTKPAALINPWEFDKLYRPIIDGMGWEVIEYEIDGFDGHRFYVVAQPGEKDRAQRIVQLVQYANRLVAAGGKVGPDYHRELGFLLGYKKSDIDHFLRNMYGDEHVANVAEGDVIKTKFMDKQVQKNKTPYAFNQEIADRIPLYDPKGRFGTYHKSGDLLHGDEVPFSRFEVVEKNDRIASLIGVAPDGKKFVVSTSPPKLAHALADAFNRGGFTDLDLQPISIGPKRTDEDQQAGAALTVFDIDETLFHTAAKILVIKDGEVVRELDNREFNTYVLKDGESFDFSQFTDAQFFHDTSVPIENMWRRAKSTLDSIGKRPGSRVIIVTARSDFDDKEMFLNTFRKHGLDIDKIHVHRAGNLNLPSAAAKKKIIGQYLATGQFDMVRLFDDAESNLRSFLSLKDDFPDIRFKAYMVFEDGNIREYKG